MNFMISVDSLTSSLQKHKNGLVFHVLFLFLFSMVPASLNAATYYVSATSGNDANTGTSMSSPWKSFTKVNQDIFNAGDTILLKRGETWHERMWFTSSGNATNPITIGAYGDPADPLPLLDGTYSGFPFAVSWTHVSGDIYRTTTPTWNSDPGLLIYKGSPRPSIATLQFSSSVSNVQPGAILLQLQAPASYCNLWVTSVDTSTNRISGITFFRDPFKHWISSASVEVRQQDTNGQETKFNLNLALNGLQINEPSLTQPGHWYWHPSEKSIYLNSEAPPTNGAVEIGQLQQGIVALGENHLIFRDLAIRGYKEVGVYFYVCDDIEIDNIHVFGIGSISHSSGILLHNTTNSVVNGCKVESVLKTGIAFFAMGSGTEHNTISNNLILNPGSAGISLSANELLQAQLVNNNTITGNTIDQANTLSYDAAGIYAMDVGTGNVLSGNTIINGGSDELRSAGIMIDGGVSAITIVSNRIENNSLGGIAVTGAGHQINDNTLRNNGVSSWESAQLIFFPVMSNASNCTVQNNAVQAGSEQKLFMKVINPTFPPEQSHRIDGNDYRSQAASPFCWSDTWTCDDWLNFDDWKTVSGQDTNSTFNKPRALTPIYQLLLSK